MAGPAGSVPDGPGLEKIVMERQEWRSLEALGVNRPGQESTVMEWLGRAGLARNGSARSGTEPNREAATAKPGLTWKAGVSIGRTLFLKRLGSNGEDGPRPEMARNGLDLLGSNGVKRIDTERIGSEAQENKTKEY